MKTESQQKHEKLREHILRLEMECPLHHDNPHDCPLYEVRKMDLPQRQRWLESLTPENVSFLQAYHFVCLKTKLDAATSA